MPIYRYRCSACNAETEVWARMDDPPPERCEACGAGPMVKAVARTAFHLKGGGWDAQGYGSSSGGKAPKSEAKSTTSTESKPASSDSASSTSSSTPTPSSSD